MSLSPPDDARVGYGERLWLLLGQLCGGAAAVAAQLALFGEVGPMATVAGVGLGAALVFWRGVARGLTRARLFGLARSSFVGCGVAGGALYGLCLWAWPARMGEAAAHPWRAVAAFALLAAAVGGITAVIVGDLFAWRAGGYEGEPPRPPPARPPRHKKSRGPS
jgi:hypothetical protein